MRPCCGCRILERTRAGNWVTRTGVLENFEGFGNNLPKKGNTKTMKVSKSSLVLTAAFTGLLGGTMTRLNASTISSESAGLSLSSAASVAGQSAGTIWQAKKEKHACKGQNSCKGKGGCKTGDNGCKGKNSCKGKGGCATDGSKKQM